MARIFPLNQLTVIGCKEVPAKSPAMPRLLSAIFAMTDSDTVLLPPYTLGGQDVIDPIIITREEFDDLVACEEVSPFEVVQAHPGHELWLDDDGKTNYTPDFEARKNLTSIFQTRCIQAQMALKSSSWPDARTHALIAYSANPKSLEPLGYRAAAEHLMAASYAESDGASTELALTEIIAKAHLPVSEFKLFYRGLVKRFSPATPPGAFTVSQPMNRCKFAGIASIRPNASKIEFREFCLA